MRWFSPSSDWELIDLLTLRLIDRLKPITVDLMLTQTTNYGELSRVGDIVAEVLHPYLQGCALGQSFRQWQQVCRNLEAVLYHDYALCDDLHELEWLIYKAVFDGVGLKAER